MKDTSWISYALAVVLHAYWPSNQTSPNHLSPRSKVNFENRENSRIRKLLLPTRTPYYSMIGMASIDARAAAGAGSVAYWVFFHRGEHFLYPVTYIQLLTMTVLTSTIVLSSSTNASFKDALALSLRLTGVFLIAVYTNCVVYRLFLNPLNKIPGPYFARLSKFNHAFQNTNFNAHLKLLEMHEAYGKFVRLGPNDISVSDADGTEVVSSAKSRCTKGPWYDLNSPLLSLHTTRDRAIHDRRRRIWAPAFSDKALRGYETRVQTFNDLLISKLTESKGTASTTSRNNVRQLTQCRTTP